MNPSAKYLQYWGCAGCLAETALDSPVNKCNARHSISQSGLSFNQR